jgi:hypothetical protein
MSACSYVGRVGGLALALGVGAAVFGGTAAAWAEDDSPATPAAETRSEQSTTTAGPTTRRTVSPGSPIRTARFSADAVKPASTTPVTGGVRVADRVRAVAAPAPSAARQGSLTASQALPAAAVAPTQPLVLGPSGVPDPSAQYVATVMDYYISPNSPGGTQTAQVVFTPEGLYPITGVKSLPLNTSVDQGLTILSDTLALLPGGTQTTIFGYSQSAIIGALLQKQGNPAAPPTIPENLRDSISFIFVGNEMNPNGGFLSRFPDLQLPSLGLDFYGATADNAYPTINYTREYDGFADFPRYPLNFLSVLNAGMGIVYVHTKYAPGSDCRTFCLTKEEVVAAVPLPTTSPTQNYYFIPTEDLPLLQPLRLLPLIGNPLADLIQPVLKVIVDLGYADPAHGFTTATQPYANILTPFGLFPEVSPLEVLTKLVDGVGQGISDFIAAFGPTGSIVRELSAISLPSLPTDILPIPTDPITAVQQWVTSVANGFSGAIASLYAGLLPTADIINAIAVSLPAYNVALVLEGVKQILAGDVFGGLINAIGLPLAADVGLVTTASLVGALVWAEAIAGVFGLTIGS